MKKPSFRSAGTPPPASTFAPSALPRSSIARMRWRERSEMTGPSWGLEVFGVADADAGDLRAEALEEGFVHRLLHEQARTAHAGLARADEGGERGAVHGAIHVHVVEQDHGALAAEFEGGQREGARGGLARSRGPRRCRR